MKTENRLRLDAFALPIPSQGLSNIFFRALRTAILMTMAGEGRKNNFYKCLRLTTTNATVRKTDKLDGSDELLLNSREYVGECRVTLLRLLSMEFSLASMSLRVGSVTLYTELVLISCAGHLLSSDVYGLMILAGDPDTCTRRGQ
jgi:hypothetical protein